jgi:hypothetical protein
MGVLDTLLGDGTKPGTGQYAQGNQQADPEDASLAVLPPSIRQIVKQKRARQAAVDSGEDPRITQFYDEEERRKRALAVLPTAVRGRVEEKKSAQAREQFFANNIDLDPSRAEEMAAQTVKIKDKAVPAEEAVLSVLKVLNTKEGQDVDGWANKVALKNYSKIKDQLTPEMRKKYNLDEIEAAGLFKGQNTSLGASTMRGLSDATNTPGIKQVLSAVAYTAAAGANLSYNTVAGWEELGHQVVGGGEPGMRMRGWGEIASNIKEKKGWGSLSQEDRNATAKANYINNDGETRVTWYGIPVGEYDPKTEKIVLNESGRKGKGLDSLLDFSVPDWMPLVGGTKVRASNGWFDRNVGLDAQRAEALPMDLVTDPTMWVGMGAPLKAKAALRELERIGMGDAANQIRKHGLGSLDKGSLEAVEAALISVKNPTARSVQAYGVEVAAKEEMAALAAGGQAGVKFAGNTVIPFSRRGDAAASTIRMAVSSVGTSDISIGDNITNLLGTVESPAVVTRWDEALGHLTIEPGNTPVVVMRKGKVEMVEPEFMNAGDKLMDGNAKILRIYEDGTVELQLDTLLNSVEHPFTIIPRYKTAYHQGTLMDSVQVPAPPEVFDQGQLFSKENEIDDAIDKVTSAPSATDAGGYASVVEKQIPTEPGVHVIDDGAGGKIIGIRGEDGKLDGYMMVTEDAVNTFENMTGVKGMGQKLLNAGEEAGLDMPKLLGNSDFTDSGRKAALRYLDDASEKLPGRIDTAAGYRRTADGGVQVRRIFRQRNGEYLLKEGETIVEAIKPPRNLANGVPAGERTAVHAANAGREIGTIMSRDGDTLVIRPAAAVRGAYQVGDPIPAVFGTLEEVLENGDWVVKADPTLFKPADAAAVIANVADTPAAAQIPGQESLPLDPAAPAQESLFPADTPALSAKEKLAGGTPVPPELADKAAAAHAAAAPPVDPPGRVPLSDLPDDPAYPDRATVPKETPKITSKPPTLTRTNPEVLPLEQVLFDTAIVSTRDLKPGQRVHGLKGVVVENKGGRVITANLDPEPQLVIRDNELVMLEDFDKNDILFDAAMEVISKNADGTITLKGLPPIGVRRVSESLMPAGLPGAPNLVDKIRPARAMRDAFSPRGSVEAAARAGALPTGTGMALDGLQAGERAALGNSINDFYTRLRSVKARLRRSQGRTEGIRLLQEAFDVGAGEGNIAQGVANRLHEAAKAATNKKKAAGYTEAGNAIETMIELRKEVYAVQEQLSKHNAVPGSSIQEQLDVIGEHTVDQMPLIFSQQAKRALGLQPNLRDVLNIEDKLDNIAQGFDISYRSGNLVLRIQDPGVAAGLKKKGSFIEIDLSRPAREANAQVAEALNESTRRALGLAEGDGFKLFEENPLTAYSYRNRTAQTAAIEQDMLRQASEQGIVTRLAIPMAEDSAGHAAFEAQKRKITQNSWAPVKGWATPGEVVYAHPTVAKELSKVRAVLHNDPELKALNKIVDKASALWVRQVLSPLTKGFGQQMRNLTSNLVNATFGGLTISGQIEAIRLQTGPLRKISKLMREEGLSFDAALLKLGLDDTSRDAVLLRMLREDDILNTGLYRSLDWGDTTEQTFLVSKAEKAKELLSPFSTRNVLFTPGRWVNTAIEDNGRMALYISNFDKTGSRVFARDQVVKYLFDYADLTVFEQHTLKNVNAFYTFMRKNTALQLKVFAERPAYPIGVLKMKNALADQNDDSLLRQDEADERGLFQAGGFLQAVIGGKGVVGIDDPVTAAIRTLDPFIQSAYLVLDKASGGKLTENLPPSERPTGQKVVKGLIGQTAGAPAEALTTMFEIGMERDFRTGRELEGNDAFLKLVNAVAPVWGQGDDIYGMIAGDKPIRTNLLKMLAGISAYNREGDDAQYSLNYAMLAELDETLKLLEAEGVDVPTLTEMRDAGLIPGLSDLPKVRTVTPTREQKQEAARKKLVGN